jgi:uncharacterized protein (DUF2147 family)
MASGILGLLPIVLLGAFASTPAIAATPVGLWTTIDDNSRRPRALVDISQTDDILSGRIVRLFVDPGEDPDPHCGKCTDSRHDQRVIGMQILSSLHRHGDKWSGGEILDPESGSVYRVTIRPSDDGQRLDVRGYVGFSLLGRTQVWERAGSPAP